MQRRWESWAVLGVAAALTPVWLLLLGGMLSDSVRAQEAVKKADVPAATPKPANPAEGTPKPEDKKADEEPAPAPAVPFNPKLVMLYLQDGTTIAGEMTIDEISVTTEFGTLKIPLGKVVSISPGLGSSPELSAKVGGLIEALGSDDYKAREQSHKDLASMGPKVRQLLEAHKNDDNAERKRHITEILKEFEEMMSDDDEGGDDKALLIEKDTVVTPDFTIVGKVAPTEFKVASKYGPLNVNLADLRKADRPKGEKDIVRKTVQVAGDNLAQRAFKNSGIKVNAGDKITFRADGSVVMSPWGSDQSSGPDGSPQFGWYVNGQIHGGALVAKIGDKGQVFKVGSKSTVIAKNSGVLQFAVAMQQQYSQQGYSFPGQYNVKITVEEK